MHLFRLIGCPLVLVALLRTAAFGAGTGLTGQYFDGSDFTTLKLTRVDPTVNFNWGTAAPTNTMAADTFSVRWSGQVEARYSETYIFHVTADDGARLWVNDRMVLARTAYSAAGLELTGRIELQAGQRYNLVLEFIENTGNANVKLEWSSASQSREIIPQSQLYATSGSRDAGSILVERWWNLPGTNLSTLTSSANYPNRPDGREFLTSFECLQRDWAENYGTRATGYIVAPTNGDYTFAVSGDDVVQLYLSTDATAANKQLIASSAAPTGFRQFTNSPGQISAAVTLVAWQRYYVELLHKQGTASDHFSVGWKPPGASQFSVIPASALVPAGLDRSPPAQTSYLDTLVPSHPRLLASAERFEWLKRNLASNSIPQLNSWWVTISNSAAAILDDPVNVYNSAGILDESRSVMDRVYKCALTYRMTGNTNFAERAWAELQQVSSSNFPDWNPSHFLDTAEMTHASAIGYDWLYDYWTQERRDTIRNAIINKGLKQSLTLYTNNSGWVASSGNNWNLVCNGGMIMGALAVGTESEPTAEYILSKAVTSAAAVMRRYTTDNGGWFEGPMYWSYATSYNMRLMGSLESALGSDFGLSKTPGLAETGCESLYMVGPGSRVAFNFADSSAYNLRGPQLSWLSRRFNRPEFSWYTRTNSGVETLDLLWYDPRGNDPQTAGLQPDNYFRGPTGTTPYSPAEIITLRSGWQDRDATFVGFKAGEIGSSHGHLDGGNFVLEALGVRWAYDIGGDDYALPGYFSKPQRWTYYRLRAEGHNTLVINPGAGADQVDGAKLPVTLYTSEPNDERAATVMDLTGAYGITKTWRGIQLFKNRRWVLIQDELQAATPANVWWFMHFRSATTSAAIQDDGASAMLTQGSDRLWFKIVSGGGTFAISNAVPLPTSPNPAGQANNDSYRKLAIHLTNVTNTTLAVLIVPLTPGENPPTGSLSLVPLTDWALGMSNTLVIRTNSAEKWSGAVSPIWNTNSLNWRTLTSGTVTNYNDGNPGDMVVFDDTLTANSAITLNTAVSPGGMAFSNSTTAYTLSGSGSVNGAGGLIKSGVNRLTLSTSNTFSGTIDIIGGSVVITNAAALGLGPKTINVKSALGNYAELHLNGSGGAITLPAECSFDTYGDTAFAGNIVNDSGDNIVNSSFNMNSGGGSPKIAVLNGSLTLNGDITCINGSSGKTLQLAGGGTNFINGIVQDGIQQARLTVLGGDWTLTNTNLYTGVTTVSGAGTLRVNGALTGGGAVTVQTGATLAGNGTVNAPVTVNNGGILRAGNISGVGDLTLGSLTLGTTSGNAQTVNVTTAAIITVLGALTNRGTTTINFSSASAITPGIYPLITYTGTTVTSGFVLGSLPPRVTGTLQYNAGSIDLIITTGMDWPKWAGTASPIWDTNAVNWRLVNAGTPTTYIDGNPGDAVLFDDSLTLNPSIALNRTVNPAAVTFSNVTTAYTLSGSGSIAGAGTLAKYGTNTLTLSTANSFSGTVTVGGRVIINNSAALGIGSKTVIVESTAGNYAELHLNGSGGPITLPASFRFDTYGDAVFAGNLVNDAGDNVINSSLNMASGGGYPKIAVLGGSLTFNGDIWCTNGSSGKTMQLAGVGVNTINGQIRNGNKVSSLLVLGGTWILNNMNTYSGATTVATNGTLVVNGATGSGAITVQNGGRLSGNGLLGGATTNQAGGTLSPGNSVGTLTLANKNLSLAGTAIMEIARNGAVLTNDQVAGISICTEGGMLIVTNVGSSALQVGDSFQLFAATNYTGAFTQIIYPAGYTFTNSLNVDGRIWVASAPSTVPPSFAPGGISRLPDRNIAITATGELGTAFRLWATTNLGLKPVTSTWTLLTNGTVTASPFTIVDNSASNFPQRFYLFSAP